MRLLRAALALTLLLAAPASASVGPGDGVPTNPEDYLPAGRFLGACEGRKYAAVFDNRDSEVTIVFQWYRWDGPSRTVKVVTRHVGPGRRIRTAFRPVNPHTAMIITAEGEALRIKISTRGWSNRACPR